VSAHGKAAPVGDLDVAAVKRAWPAVLAEIKKLRAPRAYIFNGTEAEIVSGTLIVEFPADQGFALDLARETETLAVLRKAVRAVLGQEPPVEYRLGRQGRSNGPVPGCDEPAAQAVTPASANAPVESPAAARSGAAPEALAAQGAPTDSADLASVLAELGGELLDDVTPEPENS
jgi:hypothetical protein